MLRTRITYGLISVYRKPHCTSFCVHCFDHVRVIDFTTAHALSPSQMRGGEVVLHYSALPICTVGISSKNVKFTGMNFRLKKNGRLRRHIAT